MARAAVRGGRRSGRTLAEKDAIETKHRQQRVELERAQVEHDTWKEKVLHSLSLLREVSQGLLDGSITEVKLHDAIQERVSNKVDAITGHDV